MDVPAAGEYTIDTRVSSVTGGGTFHIEFNGVDKTGDVTVPVTGGWQNWTTVSTPVNLAAGPQIMRFVANTTGFNVNYFDVTRDVSAVLPGLPATGYALHPCYPNPFNPATTISFDLPEPATVNLVIYDVAGKLVKTLVAAEVVGSRPP